MPKRKSEWEELDAWAVMRERADTLLKKLYKLTTRTASEISKGTKIDMDLTQKALDYLVEQGKINRFDDAPGYDKPVYGISPEKDKIATSNADMELAERVVWHCLGKKGRLVP
ncbi:MAG: hypothetical protein HY811_09830 [Planctomycetes bacterium]|nr:hypothetical protein [Planctomycetota bacterium]